MPVTRTYECDDCGHRETVLHLSRDEPAPACSKCSGNARAQVSAPHIAKSIGRTGDATYRAMEDAARGRAELVAAQTGEPVHETGMLVTDMRDNLRPGDLAAASTPIVRANHYVDPAAGAEHARSVHVGPYPLAGSTSPHGWSSFKANHGALRQELVRAGEMGRH